MEFIVSTKNNWWSDEFLEIDKKIDNLNSFLLLSMPGVGSTQVCKLIENKYKKSNVYNVSIINASKFFTTESAIINLKNFLLQFTAHKPHKIPILIIDDFEIFLSEKNINDLDFLAFFLEEYKRKIILIISINKTAQNISNLISPFLASKLLYKSVYIKPLNKESSFLLINHLLTKNKVILETQKVYQLTGGHVRLIKFVCESLAASKTAKDLIKNYEYLYPVCYPILNCLSKVEQLCVEKGDYKNSDLENIGFLKNKKIFAPLMEYFVNQHFAKSIHVKELFMDSAGLIFLNGERVDKKLTQLEYKLFKYLYTNNKKIVSKDEIAESIWETKQNEGISTESIDQLILRLRKKIEADYTTPKYIQSIRGRGFVLNA